MTKEAFAEKLANKCDLSKSKALEVIDCIFSTKAGEGIIAVELDAGRDFGVVGFGTWKTRRSKARKGRNPHTGEELMIAPRTVVSFKPGQGLKERVRV